MHRLTALFSVLLLVATACTQEPKPFTALAPASGGEAAEHGAPAAEGGEHGAEGGEGHAKKKTADEKPKPDSVISSVMALPVVKKWSDWVEAKGNGNHMIAWGEYITEAHGKKCWSIVVAEENDKGTTTWKRFCMEQKGLEMWVESALGAKSDLETNYITYEEWMSSCKPTYNSAGSC